MSDGGQLCLDGLGTAARARGRHVDVCGPGCGHPPAARDEGQRRAELHACGVLGTAPEPVYDDVAALTATALGTANAAVSLVDDTTVWTKAALLGQGELTPRSLSLCARVVGRHRPLVVEDARAETRLAGHPAVRSGAVVRYAGVPVVTRQGFAVGVVSAFDDRAGGFDDDDLVVLHVLARHVSLLLDVRLREQHDRLTGLPAGAAVRARMERALAAGPGPEGLLVVSLGLDGLRSLNDDHGHDVGDAVLREMGARLRRRTGQHGFAGRLGADEFAVVLPAVQGVGAEQQADELLQGVGDPVDVDGRAVAVSTRAGVVHVSGTVSVDDVLHDAAVARAAAQARGGARVVVVDDALRRVAQERAQLLADLPHAVDRGELFLQHQPKVDMRTGQVHGVEALARWRHPERGAVPPAVFVPLAEQGPLIRVLGRWVLEQACREHAARRRRDPAWAPIVMWVNVSAHQLTPDLPDEVAAALAAAGLPATALGLEVTESALMDDLPAATGVLEQVHASGVRLAIDDFGTGWSSLAALKHLPLDVLKIDRAFVAGLGQDRRDDSIAGAVIALASALRIRVIAEGVETAGQRDRLLELGCENGQGYLYARPGPLDAVPCVLGLRSAAPLLPSPRAQQGPLPSTSVA